MKPEDLFGVIVRTIGVIFLLMGFNELIERVLDILFSDAGTKTWIILRRISPQILFGILFTFFADACVRVTYRKRT